MLRIPDQSLFAWGDVYLPASQAPRSPTPAKNATVMARASTDLRPFLPQSPDDFAHSRNVRVAQLQLPGSNIHKIDYTFTPYGICTTFPIIPLTGELFSQILTPLEVESDIRSLWYLAIFGCEHIQHPGHLLGRVCSIGSSALGVDFVGPAHIRFLQPNGHYTGNQPQLLPLSPQTIEHCRPRIELKTAYMSRPESNDTDQGTDWRLQRQPYVAIKLVLLSGSLDLLRSRGYSADFRDPDRDHPTTHLLTLSKDEHTIVVEFQHTLEDDGRQFTINAKVELLGCCVQLDSASGSDQADHRMRHTLSCEWDGALRGGGRNSWKYRLEHKSFELRAARVGALAIDLNLRLLGTGVYSAEVSVVHVPPTPPEFGHG